ncbi:hypothetical protein Dfri01_56440 [Dyadobacter frigoris]|nr:hypothetical protein Dfri01_56440 [Dyadobacter frigoris]
MVIQSWCERNNVEVIDTFTDEGFSARNFDRPDFKRLNRFIEKHYRTVDHLVVFAFDRFSRDAGEAIVAIKKLQRQYAIKVVSVSEGITFDADDPGSFFYAGLMLLKGEDEIIRNKVRINMGIYTAKKRNGRFLGKAPYGYKNATDAGRKPILVVDKEETNIVQLIYDLFLRDTPISAIEFEAKKLGFNLKGNGSVQRILKNPIYRGLILVRAYREFPEELVKGIHTPIIDETTWLRVQERFKPKRQNVQITDNLPLRGVLKCHCGQFLTGAASRGAGGSYYFYYKCKKSGHNNIPATKAHEQFEEIMQQLSLSVKIAQKVKKASQQMFDEKVKDKKKMANQQKLELEEIDKKLRSLEEKWINNQIEFETYSHWQKSLSSQRRALKMKIDTFGHRSSEISDLFQQELNKFSELKSIYLKATTIQKHHLIKLVFDNRLYYKDGTYRTPFLTDLLIDNNLNINKLTGIIFEKKGENNDVFSLRAPNEIRTHIVGTGNRNSIH